jgi:hypothetical protein
MQIAFSIVPNVAKGLHRRAGLAEQVGAVDRHPGHRHPRGETQHQRVQARHLMDDDHRRSGPAPVHRPRPAALGVGEFEAVERLQARLVRHADPSAETSFAASTFA